MSFKEKFDEIVSDFGGRVRNPLIGSFILVWLIQNWNIIFIFFNLDSRFSFGEKLTILRYCLDYLGWKGLIGYPLANAFISLICYYFIGVLSQLIKVGARSLNGLVGKLDMTDFVPRAEFKKEIAHSKTLKKELAVVNDENKSLIDFKHNAQQEYNIIARRLDEAERNILSNGGFQKNVEETLLFLLSKYASINQENIKKPQIHPNYYNVLNGSWNFHRNSIYSKDSGPTNGYKIFNDKVVELTGEEYGEIIEFNFDRQYKMLTFTIHKNKDQIRLNQKWEKFNLFQLTVNEFIGFSDNQFCHIKRHD